MALSVDTPVQYVKGVGPKLAAVLRKKGITTVRDLIEFYPRTYEDRRAARNIASLKEGDFVGLKAQVVRVHQIPIGKSSRKIYDLVVRDNSGVIHCKFFRVPYRGYFERFPPGTEVRVIGKVINYRNEIQFHHPELHNEADDAEEDELIPVYSETEGLSSKKLRNSIKAAFESMEFKPNQKEDPFETLPSWIRKKFNLAPRGNSLYNLHFPQIKDAALFLERKTEYHNRIIFDEFFLLELILASRKKGLSDQKAEAVSLNLDGEEQFKKSLPFELTDAQKKVLAEIKTDIQKTSPMNRLVQGDVGSGKTVVALIAALHAISSGQQVAFMAPTEILAQQHLKQALKFLSPLDIQVEILVGNMKSADKQHTLSDIKEGKIQLVIGTHALIQDTVHFKNLGLVIVDEQHRFGVGQRSTLRRKGISPHFLLMTATPIPRSLAMTVYGDLDISAITEMPKGRIPIITRVTYQSKRAQVLGFVKEHLAKGRQAYIIFPLVEESEKIDLKSAITEFEKLKVDLEGFRVGLLHGRMKGDEKDAVMAEFRDHKIDVLVSTTVIEVGVDVPNANIIWVEHAERFGLAQLHQLRGRVGRGEHKSYCVLMMGYAKSPEAVERVSFLERTNDGFKISEFDLELRGPGEFLGVRQSGMPGFKLANLVRDIPILEQARSAALELFMRDPSLKENYHKDLRTQMNLQEANLS
jgi:ATP-dependent DNA helicase RecG